MRQQSGGQVRQVKWRSSEVSSGGQVRQVKWRSSEVSSGGQVRQQGEVK